MIIKWKEVQTFYAGTKLHKNKLKEYEAKLQSWPTISVTITIYSYVDL